MKLGAYEVIRPLGSGGMSDALLARSPAGRVVVLKKPRSYDPELVARMRDEGRLGSRIYHANLVETLDTFDELGLPVLVLGFVEGPTLDEVRKVAPLPPAAVARVGCQIAEALGAIHDAIGDDGRRLAAVHRDVSGRNIIVTPKGDAVLIDLGISRYDEMRAAHTETGMVLGTLRYMAPEIVDGIAASPASDFYSLGCVLIEAATGSPAFAGVPSEVAHAIVTKGPLASAAAQALEPRLKDAIAKMTAMKPGDRFREAHEVSATLRAIEAALGGGAPALAASAVPAAPLPSASLADGFNTQPVATTPVATVVVPRAGEAPQPITVPMRPAPTFVPEPPQPALPPPRPLPQAPVRNDAPLELAVEPRRKTALPAEVPKDPRDWYPKTKRDYGWLKTAATRLLMAVLVVGGLFAAWRYYEANQEQTAADAAAALARENERLLQDAMKEMTPDCHGAGSLWVYTDKRGTEVVVDDTNKIPKQFRAKARCASSAR